MQHWNSWKYSFKPSFSSFLFLFPPSIFSHHSFFSHSPLSLLYHSSSSSYIPISSFLQSLSFYKQFLWHFLLRSPLLVMSQMSLSSWGENSNWLMGPFSTSKLRSANRIDMWLASVGKRVKFCLEKIDTNGSL